MKTKMQARVIATFCEITMKTFIWCDDMMTWRMREELEVYSVLLQLHIQLKYVWFNTFHGSIVILLLLINDVVH